MCLLVERKFGILRARRSFCDVKRVQSAEGRHLGARCSSELWNVGRSIEHFSVRIRVSECCIEFSINLRNCEIICTLAARRINISIDHRKYNFIELVLGSEWFERLD